MSRDETNDVKYQPGFLGTSLGTSRRGFLKSAAVVGASTLLPAGAATALMRQATSPIKSPSELPKLGRIDIHGHFTPPILIATMGAEELGGFAKWTPERALEEMNTYGVVAAMTSIPPHYDPATVDKIARPSNEFAARMSKDHPGKFGIFAFLPLPHIDTTLKEIEYVYDTLKLEGVGMYTNYGDKWLGDSYFNPIFEELNRRNAIIFTHPITADCCKDLLKNVGDGTIEWQTDTTRAIANMFFNGAAFRYPNVRMIFSHGGGTMPYLVERFRAAARGPKQKANFPDGFDAAAAKYFYDTAWTSNNAAQSTLSKVVPVSQIVLGTDYPARAIGDHVIGMQNCGVYTQDQLQKIERENALALFPKFRLSS
jgi:predicted TIM-barrel fold metal-dependent hydrolase